MKKGGDMMLLEVLFISFASLHLLTLSLSFLRFYIITKDITNASKLQKCLDSDVMFITLDSLSGSTKYATIFLAIAVLIEIFINF
ncbi:hypothetical protein EBU91_00980 [bacterium]|nr:hypothetical protein [bacterium]